MYVCMYGVEVGSCSCSGSEENGLIFPLNEVQLDLGCDRAAHCPLIITRGVHDDAVQNVVGKCKGKHLALCIENENVKIIGSSVLNYVWSQGSLELWFSLFCQRKKETRQEAASAQEVSLGLIKGTDVRWLWMQL